MGGSCDLSDDIELAHRLADAAGWAILPHFRAPYLIADNKQAGVFDPESVSDSAA